MKVFDFKKSILAVAAIAMSLTASAQTKTDIVESGYCPAGSSFSKEASIDWDTQKVVASIDLTTCSTTTLNENILSVGQNISTWNGSCFHLYYTRASKSLQVNYCSGTGNPIRVDISNIYDTIQVESSTSPSPSSDRMPASILSTPKQELPPRASPSRGQQKSEH